jgi:hypothetical protein
MNGKSVPARRRALDHFGLVRPYRFERILALLVALGLAIAVGAVAFLLWMRGGFAFGAPRGLSWATPRGWYFVYLAGLLVLGLALARWPRAAAVVLALASLEIGLGFGSALLYEAGLAKSPILFPDNYRQPPYEWHPLLQVRPQSTPADEATTARVFINSEHMRGPERTSGKLKDKIVIALFGGSTTLDFASPNGQSWGERLEQKLGPDRYAVLNHGVAGYTTAEHLIQTAFYEQAFGTPPHCALYYVGWNDLSAAHTDGLDGGYANVHMRTQIDAFMGRRLDDFVFSISPTLSLLARFAVLAFDTVRPAEISGTISGEPDRKLEEIYLRNVRAISAINRQRGITTVWIGQIMNRAELVGESIRGWAPFVRDKDTWPLIARLNGLLRREAKVLGDAYIDVRIEEFQPDDFVDEGHFSPAGSMKFATLLETAVAAACK